LNLKNIDLKIKLGEFVTVVGDVGSGKSSLLSAINGDMLFVPQDYVSLECTLVA
jgi:ABC-type phosphate/phosphonate transport system ATPase subunit